MTASPGLGIIRWVADPRLSGCCSVVRSSGGSLCYSPAGCAYDETRTADHEIGQWFALTIERREEQECHGQSSSDRARLILTLVTC